MKWVIISVYCLMLPFSAEAQYEKVRQEDSPSNSDLQGFVSQQRVLWNFGWEFSLGTKQEEWKRVDLPHDFQWEQPWQEKGSAQGFKPSCEGWYRKTFKANPLWKGKRVTLDFGGIIYLGDVFLNGHKVASTDYGYVGFEADLTPYLDYKGDNTVTVWASSGPRKGSRWYTGGGIFRDVYLKVKNPTHIARHGVFICTKDNKEVHIQVEVDGWQKHDISVKAQLLDADGNTVGTTKATMPKHTRQTTTEVQLPAITMSEPHLWSPESPYLYSADLLVYDGKILVDSIREHFGIRTLEFSPEFGFKLNGKKLFLKGNANHHDLGALGAASYDSAIERMMRRLKEFGYNCIRCSHNPYSESFTRIADRLGLLIVDELIDKWSDKSYWGGRQPFTAIWPQLVMEWVKRDRNSPSVILWSLGNELQVREDWTGYQGLNDWGVTMYRVMDQVVKRFDPTRLTTVAQFPARAGAITQREKDYNDYIMPPELAQATDVASLNYQSAWYADFVKHCPKMNIFQSEAETSAWLAPYYNMDHEHSIGMAYWGSIEYWGESNGWPKKGWNYSFFSHTLQPYPTAWLVKSAFCMQEPVVRIGILDPSASESVNWNDVQVGQTAILSHWNFPKGSRQHIYVFTNAPQVELLSNGKSLGVKPNDGQGNMQHVVTWDVDYGTGGILTAIARANDGSETARHEVQTAGRAIRLEVEQENKWKADGMALLYLNVSAVDAKGNIVPNYDEELTVDVIGPASVLAIDNGDHYTNDLFVGVKTKNMRNGRMQVILRAGRLAGKVIVKVSTPRLKKTFKTILNEI